MSVDGVRDAYGARSGEYIGLFGSIEAAADEDRRQVLTWATSVAGTIIDIGCGPGQWTSYLADHGVDIEGVDPVPAFIDEARRKHPNGRYRIGRADALDVADATLGGILAWFSLIHTEPEHLGPLLDEFARCVRPGGGLAIGFFEGPDLAPFDHAVTTAYFWPIDELCARIEQHGFEVTTAEARSDPGVRRQGIVLAERRR
jgi:SAM-dependent methyltransferase